ncbi:MAG TPA: TatD family hydrolase [Terriglobales bacterium]
MYIDSHAHLDSRQFASDREAVLLRAHAAGLTHILTIGNGDGPMEMDCAVNIAREVDAIAATGLRVPKVLASAGVHPHEAKMVDDAARGKWYEVAADPAVIAWGEIGLDYHYHHSARDVQEQVFVEQLALAAEFDLPIIIHNRPTEGTRDAFDDLFRILREHWQGRRGILHCFTGGPEEAREALDLGFVISFAGNVSFAKMQQIRDAAAMVPDDSFFIETDCPYLAPVPHRGKRNEPGWVTETARHIGDVRGASGEAVGQQASANFHHFFGQFSRSKNL